MARDQQNGSVPDGARKEEEEEAAAVRSRSKSLESDEKERSKGSRDRSHRVKSKRREDEDEEGESSGEDSRERRKRRRKEKERRRRRRRSRSESSGSSSESESSYSGSSAESESELDSEEERRRRRRRRRKEKEEEERRRRRKEKEKRKRKEKERERDKKKKRKEEKKDMGKKAAVTNSWGKYGIIREVDMWNKRPEFTAWLLEVKQEYGELIHANNSQIEKVNLESLSNWEEKQMFKEFMEDHNTATFPSKKYYNLDTYHRRMIEKEKKKGLKNVGLETVRTVFNDEEQRRLELLKERERRKEEEVTALKRSMQTGMAQAMKEQALLREEMVLQYKLGNFEAAAAIQKRLDPDAPVQ